MPETGGGAAAPPASPRDINRSLPPGRIAVGVEYDGSAYSGWQRQPTTDSIQSLLEAALGFVAAHPVVLQCAGRTDAGVHAVEQVAHFDTTVTRTERAWVLGANTRLPPDIAVHWAVSPTPGFHARFSALRRRYRYLILDQPTRPAIDARRAWWQPQPLDVAAMQSAAQCLVGVHDFSSFRAAECQSSTPLRRVERIDVRRDGRCVSVAITANAFLHHMVRNIVGTLAEVGTGERPPGWVAEVLAARDRRVAGPTAPAHGLYFESIDYPADSGLPVTGPVPSAMIAARALQQDRE